MSFNRTLAAGAAILSSSLLSGCGLHGSINVHKNANGSYTVSGQPSHSTNSSPSASTTPSSNPVSSNPPSSPSFSVNQNTVTTPSSGSASTQPSGSSTTSSSQLNSVATQSLHEIAGHTGLNLAVPTSIPAPLSGYLTATTHASLNQWQVHLLDTTQPVQVNSPHISQYLSTLPHVGSFGAIRIAPTLTSTSQLIRQNNYLWNPQFAVSRATAHESIMVGNSHAALIAQAYAFNGNYNDAKLVWREGNWTIEIVGSSPRYEQQIAFNLVNFLHSHYLPPFPGLIMLQMIKGSPHNASTAVTRIDWLHGHHVNEVSDRQPTFSNPINVAHMATSWTTFTP